MDLKEIYVRSYPAQKGAQPVIRIAYTCTATLTVAVNYGCNKLY